MKWGSQYDGFEYNEAINSGEGVGDNFSFGSADFNSGLVWTFRNDKNYFSSGNKNGLNTEANTIFEKVVYLKGVFNQFFETLEKEEL